MTTVSTRSRRLQIDSVAALLLALVTALGAVTPAAAQNCLSPDPSQWPTPAKPYFMVVFDTSGSMTQPVASGNSCGFPSDRLGHGRCALRNLVKTFTGLAHFGLATYAVGQTGCTGGTCFTGCTQASLPNDAAGASCTGGCGAEPNPAAPNSSSRAGANILVPLNRDDAFTPSNLVDLLSYDDNDCTGSKELFASGCTPLNGALRDMYRYLSSQWTAPGGGTTYLSPLTSVAAGERACRTVNVILITDGDETCDAAADAVSAAAALNAGFVKDGITWSVKTYVINFAGGSTVQTDSIASAGGTGTSLFATNEVELTTAISSILTTGNKAETCDNVDNNCNGCTDEGFTHYANVNQPCCAWSNPSQRTTCLNSYAASITVGNPNGNRALLPCTTFAQQNDPSSWLCFDPGEVCDSVDNNGANGVDDGILKCGSPLQCPSTEVCNARDDDCDQLVDEGGVCGSCVPSAEICDGCDNDCDGIADDGSFSSIACGTTSPANCNGTRTCQPPQPVPVGGCLPGGGGYNACNNSPQTESCDGIDNDCDGITDDSVPSTQCVPVGFPPGLVYGGTSQCVRGQTQCTGGAPTCVGAVSPSAEVCDGIDNNCDGAVDNGASGVGQACGISQAPCAAGTTACVGGSLVCQGGVGPQPEVCDGVDNNCNGSIDDLPLADAPAAGQSGCWSTPGSSCSHGGVTWDAPAGATCTGNGSLSLPCHRGSLVCASGAWSCQSAKAPSAESCDGVDNDCNGSTDDGGGLCGAGLTCQSGLCRP